MVSFEGLIAHNKRLSILLFFLLLLLLGGLGASVSYWWGGEWYTGVIVATAVAVIYFLFSWFAGASMILSMSGARKSVTKTPRSSGTSWRSSPSQEDSRCRRSI